MKRQHVPTVFGFVLGLVGTLVFVACGDPGDCGPIELYSGEYKVKYSRWFADSPPMEKGTLVYEPELERVTVSYASSEGPATVILRAIPRVESRGTLRHHAPAVTRRPRWRPCGPSCAALLGAELARICESFWPEADREEQARLLRTH